MTVTNRLRELRARLRELQATIRQCQAERELVQVEITRERARLVQERERARVGLETNVAARWEQGMRADDIGKALGLSKARGQRILTRWRERRQITVRRGHQNPERRRLREPV